MFTHYRTRGFVIKKEDIRSADQMFTVFTDDFGKVRILGRGIRKINSKLRSGIDLFSFSDIEFIQGKNCKTLTDALVIDNFKRIKQDLRRVSAASKISESLDVLINGESPDAGISNLLKESFGKLNSSDRELANNYKVIYYHFFWNLVSILGYKPELVDGEKDALKAIDDLLKAGPESLRSLKIDNQVMEKIGEASESQLLRILE